MSDEKAREVILTTIANCPREVANITLTDAILSALAAAGLVVMPVVRLETAFVAGFGLSGEGWNGEYPGDVTREQLKPNFDAWLAAHKRNDAATPGAQP